MRVTHTTSAWDSSVVVQIRAILGGGGGGKKKPGLRIPTVVKRVRRGRGEGGEPREEIFSEALFSCPILSNYPANGESKEGNEVREGLGCVEVALWKRLGVVKGER
jgi:hypothetical protein